MLLSINIENYNNIYEGFCQRVPPENQWGILVSGADEIRKENALPSTLLSGIGLSRENLI
jgi:hypothetical protein